MNNRLLVEYEYSYSNVVPTSGLGLAMPIPLSETLLIDLGFTANGNAEYVNTNGVKIIIDGKNPNSILVLNSNPIFFVCDLQHAGIQIAHQLLNSYCNTNL